MAPLSQEEMRKELKELSASGGGSLVKRVVKHHIDKDTKVLFIGLGGMGVFTINEIKRCYSTDFEVSDNVRFLAIDSDYRAFNDYCVGNGNGLIATSESFSLYDEDARDLLKNRSAKVAKYYHENALRDQLVGDGAKATRGIGRVMLSATPKYKELKDRIKSEMGLLYNHLPNSIVHVVILAGISGGTGSGSFIDISYMVRILLAEMGREDPNFKGYSYGVFYTPDVQQSNPQIGGDRDKWASVKRNGYASFKELDYFMNLGKDKRPVYSIETLDGTFSCDQPIFERSRVFIVSKTGRHFECNDIVRSTATATLKLFMPSTRANNGIVQSVLSTLTNSPDTLNVWDTTIVAQNMADGRRCDDSGNKNCELPVFMNYNYASFGFNSIYFPRNEMAAYIANKAYIKILEEKWGNGFALSQKQIDAFANQMGIGDINSIFSAFLKSCVPSVDGLKIKPSDKANYPQRFGFELAGKIQNADRTVAEAKRLADNLYNSIVNAIKADVNQSSLAQVAKGIVDKIKHGIVENRAFVTELGPAGVLITLAGTKGKEKKGFLDKLEDYANVAFSTELAKKRKKAEDALTAMNSEAVRLSKDKNPSNEEISKLVELCFNYSKASLEELLFKEYAKKLCVRIHTALSAINKETFEIYVPILEAIKEILQQDSDVFQNSYLTRDENGDTYTMAYDLDHAMSRNDLFERFFSGYIDTEAADMVLNGLVNSIFSVETKPIWKDAATNPATLATELRKVFKEAIKPLLSGMLEKLMVVVYADRNKIKNLLNNREQLNVDDIELIWNNVELRNEALAAAARAIVSTLKNSTMVQFDIDTTVQSKFGCSNSLILLSDTPELNTAIENEIGGNPQKVVIDDSEKTEISLFSMTVPFALPLVANMHDYAQAYYSPTEKEVEQFGRHLDEVTEKWQENLPELYGRDANDYYVNSSAKGEAYRIAEAKMHTDFKRYEEIEDAVEYGIAHDYIVLSPAEATMKVIPEGLRKAETLDDLTNKILELNEADGTRVHSWIDAAEALRVEKNQEYYEEINLCRDLINGPLKARVDANRESTFELKNVYRVVRADMSIRRAVLSAKEFFEENSFFYNTENLSALQETIRTFIRAYGQGLIKKQADGYYVSYNENLAINRPIKFFDDSLRSDQELDEPLMIYLMLSAFSTVLSNERYKKGILEMCEGDDRRGFTYPEDIEVIINGLKGVDKLDLLTNRDTQSRDRDMLSRYNASRYQQYYSYPLKFRSVDTIISNLMKVAEAVDHVVTYYFTFHLNEKKTVQSQQPGKEQLGATVNETGWTCKCGKENKADANFCSGCGESKPQPSSAAGWCCPQCGKENAADARFCSGCGTPNPQGTSASWFCTQCGKENASSDNFCSGCGTKKH